MKFYDCQTAPSPRRVRMFIAEKGVEIPVVQVDLRSGEQLGEAFRTINPRCTVPVLELDDGTCLTDTLAICHYLESQFPEPNLMGVDGREQALVMNWHEQILTEGFLAGGEALRNFVKGFENRALTGPKSFRQIPELAERGRIRLELFMADIGAFVCADFASWVKLPVRDQWPNLRRWLDEISARPSASV
jgi:glutathione S-transferase